MGDVHMDEDGNRDTDGSTGRRDGYRAGMGAGMRELRQGWG